MPHTAARLPIIFLLTAALALAACGGDDDEEEEASTATVTEQPATETAEPTPEGLEVGDEAFPGVPLPTGATETTSVTYSGPEFAELVSEGQTAEDLAQLQTVTDVNTYTEVVVKIFETDASQDDLVDFYRSNDDEWEELLYAGPDAEDPSALLIWEEEEGSRVVWVGIEETSPGVSEISIFESAVGG